MGLFNFGKPKDEVLENKIEGLKQKLDKQKLELQQLKEEKQLLLDIYQLREEQENLQTKLNRLKLEISIAQDELDIQEYGFFERKYKFSDSTKYKKKLDDLRSTQKEMIKNGEAGRIVTPMTLDGDLNKGKTMQNQLIKAMIRGFNGEVDALLVKISVANSDKKIVSLKRTFAQLNKMYSRNQVEISRKYLDLKIDELNISAEYELQKQQEKELLREQREKEREEKRLQSEIKEKRKQLQKDRTHFKNMSEKVRELLKTANDDMKEDLLKQLNEYQEKLSELDELEEDIDYREAHATAGYVYVISNIGAFGEDVYKIGVTRRLEPLERIRELSSASVPFQFDVHALVFSEQAFALEAELHNELTNYRVNKVNNRKEYFKVSFDKIKEVLNRHNELTLELQEHAEAFEYRQSVLLDK